MLVGIYVWTIGGIRLARILAIRTQETARMAVCPYHYCYVVPVAFGFESAQRIAIFPASAFRLMGNWKGGY